MHTPRQLLPLSMTSTSVNKLPPNGGPLANNIHRRQGRAPNPRTPVRPRNPTIENLTAHPNSAAMAAKTIWSCRLF
jgi:hypothetical protein